MTLEELNAIYRQSSWLIAKRSGSSALKALLIGKERLEDIVSEIADLYQLGDGDRRRILPVIAGDIHGSVAAAVDVAKAAVGFGPVLPRASELPLTATEQTRLAASAMALVTIAPKTIKAHPAIAAASVAYAVGSAGWFAYHARAYNRAAYDLVRATIDVSESPISDDAERAFVTSQNKSKSLLSRLRALRPMSSGGD